MDGFEKFVNHIVTKWRKESKLILEKGGLGIPVPNRIAGDLSENFVAGLVVKLKPPYETYFASGSQTPSDIYSIINMGKYWHIMLIQVKSSKKLNRIENLNDNKISQFSELAKFLKREITASGLLENYKTDPILISTGYAGVLTSEKNKKIQHQLIKTKSFKLFKINSAALDTGRIIPKLKKAHKLGMK